MLSNMRPSEPRRPSMRRRSPSFSLARRAAARSSGRVGRGRDSRGTGAPGARRAAAPAQRPRPLRSAARRGRPFAGGMRRARMRDGDIAPLGRVERWLACFGQSHRPSTSTAPGKSTRESRPPHRRSVTTSGCGSSRGCTPGSKTTARPARRPAGNADHVPSAAVPPATQRPRRADASHPAAPTPISRWLSCRRSPAYSAKSPRSQCIRAV